MHKRPKSVQRALIIMLSILAVEYSYFLIILVRQEPHSLFINYFQLFLRAILSCIPIFFIVERHNWARWVYVFFAIIQISSAYNLLLSKFQEKLILGTIGLIQILLYLVIIFLLFSKDARSWFRNEKNIEKENLNKSNSSFFKVLIGLFFISLPFLGSLYLLIMVFSFGLIQELFFDGKSDFYASEIGKEVHFAPLTIMAKMNDYGGWRDQYLHIFASNRELNNLPRLNEFKTFKVSDKKTYFKLLNQTRDICIIEDIKNKDFKASLDCEAIPHVNEVTKIIAYLSKEIKIKGKTYVASTADRRNSNLKSILKINDFIVYEISNEEELRTLVAPNDSQFLFYESIMRFSHLIPLKESEVLDEHAQSKIFIHYFGGEWSDELFGYSSFESYIQNNMPTRDMEKWIMENHSNPRDRWAIRSILSIVQQAILVEQKMDSYKATEFIIGLEQSKECVAKYYGTPGKAIGDINNALRKFFEISDRKIAFEKIKSRYDSTYAPNPSPCHQFFPPVACGGLEKCVNWTR